jgi:CRISPR system Cascade subunit CasD
MARHLLMRLRAPLIAFGGEAIDNFGVIRDFPALSMVTGLLANALGYDRADDAAHNRLQARLRLGTRLDGAGSRLQDYQTAELLEDDRGWTTLGRPEGRAKSPSYEARADGRRALTLQRYRDYHADLDALLVLRLEPADEAPTLDDLQAALDRPARPLFIGRKPCLPTGRLFAGWVEAPDVLGALQQALPVAAAAAGEPRTLRLQWPEGEGRLPNDRLLDVCDERQWTSGVHGGWRPVREGVLRVEPAASTEAQAEEQPA